MSQSEDTYGTKKRLSFLSQLLDNPEIENVLDYGCGNGGVSAPLAEIFPDKFFTAVDTDITSIEYARKNHNYKNLHFQLVRELHQNQYFDFIIASEVIEHVESPDLFLAEIIKYLRPDGRLFLTLPNGYGPFEIASTVESLLQVSGVYNILRNLKKSISGGSEKLVLDTHAVSPHINFFSFSRIKKLIRSTGFNIISEKNRTFLCGFGFDQLINRLGFVHWNSNIADRLPAWMVSDWMFLLKVNEAGNHSYIYTRNWYARIRRCINEYIAKKQLINKTDTN